MSWRLRPIHAEDIPGVQSLLHEKHTGITNVPEGLPQIEQFVSQSISSFKNTVLDPGNQLYYFVLEDFSEKQVVGISAIRATTGGDAPLYFYKRERLENPSKHPDISQILPVLQPISYMRGPSEICSLFLDEATRGRGLGRLLSLGRFLYIADQPHRFTSTLCTELRGVIRDDGSSPFWSGIGAHFIRITFKKALELLHEEGRSIIPQFLPRFPIYIDLLPPEVRDVIGKTHVQTQAALSLLAGEGFQPSDEIDVFDGGPKLQVDIDQIRTITESQTARLAFEPIHEDGRLFLVANCLSDFRCTISTLSFSSSGEIHLPFETWEMLEVVSGDVIRFSPISGKL